MEPGTQASETYNTSEAAAALGIDRSTLWKWMKDGLAPPHFKLGRRVFFPKKQLTQWLQDKAEANG